MRAFVLLILITFTCLFKLSAQTLRYVSVNGSGNYQGGDWQNTLNNAGFRMALVTANPGDSFFVAAGTYHTFYHQDSSFVIKKGVKIFGGFPTSGNPSMLNRNWLVNKTILDADIDENDITTLGLAELGSNPTRQENNNYLVTYNQSDSNSLLDGFHLLNGRVNNVRVISGISIMRNCSLSKAGNYAMYNTSTQVAIYENITIDFNVAMAFFKCQLTINTGNFTNNGGAIKIMDKEANISNCNFINNKALNTIDQGGAIRVDETNVLLNNCFFSDNKANEGADVYGGYSLNKIRIDMVNCTVSNRAAVNANIRCYDSLFMQNCVVTGCRTSGQANVYTRYGWFRNTHFANNASNSGAISLTDINMDSCSFDANYAPIATIVVGSTGLIKNTLFTKNNGISIRNNGWNLIIDKCTFSRNLNYSYYSTSAMDIRNSLFLNSRRGILVTNQGSGMTFNLNNCLFDSCYTDSSGAAVYFNGTKLQANNCAFINNRAGKLGGAIYAKGTLYLHNCLLAKNVSKSATVYATHSSIPPFIGNIRSCTFFGNTCDTGVAGFYIPRNSPSPQVNIFNTIFWSNQNRLGTRSLFAGAGITQFKRNIIEPQPFPYGDSLVHQSTSYVYPNFSDSSKIKGNDQTLFTNDDGLIPSCCSFAINAGDSNLAFPGETKDITGAPRVTGNNMEIGCYEKACNGNGATPFGISIYKNSSSICANDPLQVGISITPYFPYFSANWYINGIAKFKSYDTLSNFPTDMLRSGDTLQCILHHTDGCTLDSAISNVLPVQFQNILPNNIIGDTIVHINDTSTFSTTFLKDYQYTWLVQNGTILGKTDSNSITIQWGPLKGSGFVSAYYTSPEACNSSISSLNISIRDNAFRFIQDTIYAPNGIGLFSVNVDIEALQAWNLSTAEDWITLPNSGFRDAQIKVNLNIQKDSILVGRIYGAGGGSYDTLVITHGIANALLESQATNLACKIIPNPSSSYFNIELPEEFSHRTLNYSIYNAFGEFIQSKKGIGSQQFYLQQTGLYLLIIKDENGITLGIERLVIIP